VALVGGLEVPLARQLVVLGLDLAEDGVLVGPSDADLWGSFQPKITSGHEPVLTSEGVGRGSADQTTTSRGSARQAERENNQPDKQREGRNKVNASFYVGSLPPCLPPRPKDGLAFAAHTAC